MFILASNGSVVEAKEGSGNEMEGINAVLKGHHWFMMLFKFDKGVRSITWDVA